MSESPYKSPNAATFSSPEGMRSDQYNRGDGTIGRKLNFRGFSRQPKVQVRFHEEAWVTLKEAINAIFRGEGLWNQEELYQVASRVCSNKEGNFLYLNIYSMCESRMIEMADHLRQVDASDKGIFLISAQQTWQRHCSDMLNLRNVFLLLDRMYLKSEKHDHGVRSLYEMGLRLFKERVATHPDIEHKIISGLLLLVEKDRNGDVVDKSMLKNMVHMLLELGMYETSFEVLLLRRTEEFYLEEGNSLIGSSDVIEYVLHVERRLKEESERAALYLWEASARKPLVDCVEQQLISRHVEALVGEGFVKLMDNERYDIIGRLWGLLNRVSALDAMKKALSLYVRQVGTSLVSDPARDDQMVLALVTFKGKLDDLLENALHSSEEFGHVIRSACEYFVNTRSNRPAELIAKYIDTRMKSGDKTDSEENLEIELNRVLAIFRFIQGKDVFEAFYTKDLAKRLLLNRSASIDAEKTMIAKLKAECGAGFTYKLEGMFKDVDISEELMRSYRANIQDSPSGAPSIELGVQVLTSAYWPPQAALEIKLPEQVAAAQEHFRSFYLNKHSGRRLTWQPALTTAILKATVGKTTYEVAVSCFQAIVLLCFSNQKSLEYPAILEATQLEDGELRRTLQSLACGKLRLLTKEPKSKDVSPTDVFSFNEHFESKRRRIKINQIQMSESREEQEETTEKVFQDRQLAVDAAVVRIMKTRKTLSHNLLISELFKQLSFPVKPADLKKRIESLIDREYLEREETNASNYRYLA